MKSEQAAPRNGHDHSVAVPDGAQPDPTSAGGRSGLDLDVDGNSASIKQAGWSSKSITKWDQSPRADRRSEKIRSWRKRALLKRGARLHMTMASKASSSSLAMLDETGMVVSWYGSSDGLDYASEEVVDRPGPQHRR